MRLSFNKIGRPHRLSMPGVLTLFMLLYAVSCTTFLPDNRQFKDNGIDLQNQDAAAGEVNQTIQDTGIPDVTNDTPDLAGKQDVTDTSNFDTAPDTDIADTMVDAMRDQQGEVSCEMPQGMSRDCVDITGVEEGVCAVDFKPEGTLCTLKTPKPCSTGRCDSKGFCQAVLSCDDGLDCTEDHCDTNGHCQHVVQPGYCMIGNTCYKDGDKSPGNPCKVCDSSKARDEWTNVADNTELGNGQRCFDGLPCNYAAHCANKECGSDGCGGSCWKGARPECDDGNVCTKDVCGSDGTCTHIPNNKPMCKTKGVCQKGVPWKCDTAKRVYVCDYQAVKDYEAQEVSCDHLDNDCNGRTDEAFHLDTDLNNCGDCGHKCVLQHAKPTCKEGQCKVEACEPGYSNNDGNDDNGCEHKVSTWYVNCMFPESGDGSKTRPFNSMEAALAKAEPHDTITIQAGTCLTKGLVISKNAKGMALSDLTIQGAGQDKTIIQNTTKTSDTINVKVDRITIRGLTVTGGMSGIHVQGTDGHQIRGGTISNVKVTKVHASDGNGDQAVGIWLENTRDMDIEECKATDITGGLGKVSEGDQPTGLDGGMGAGLYLYNSQGANITGLDIEEVTGGAGPDAYVAGNGAIGAGIYMDKAKNCMLQELTITSVTGGTGGGAGDNGLDAGTGGKAAGIYILDSQGNTFQDVTVDKIVGGVAGKGYTCAAPGDAIGVYLDASEGNTFTTGSFGNLRAGGHSNCQEGAQPGAKALGVWALKSNTCAFKDIKIDDLAAGGGWLAVNTKTNTHTISPGGMAAGYYVSACTAIDIESGGLTQVVAGDGLSTKWPGPGGTAVGIYFDESCQSCNAKGVNIESIHGGRGGDVKDTKDTTITGGFGGESIGIFADSGKGMHIQNCHISNIKGGTGGLGYLGGFVGGDSGDGGPATGIRLVKCSDTVIAGNIIGDGKYPVMGGPSQGYIGTHHGGNGGSAVGIESYQGLRNAFSKNIITNITGATTGLAMYPGAPGNATGIQIGDASDLILDSNMVSQVTGGETASFPDKLTGGGAIGISLSGLKKSEHINKITNNKVIDIAGGHGTKQNGPASGYDLEICSGTDLDADMATDINGSDSQGIRITSCIGMSITHSIIAHVKGSGIGIYGPDSAVTLVNNTIAFNDYGVYFDSPPKQSNIRNCIFYESDKYCIYNSSGQTDVNLAYYSLESKCSKGIAYGGNLDNSNLTGDNPRFRDPESFKLLPSSDAIDRGDPKDPFCNEPSPNGCRINIGAYGNTKYATSGRESNDCVCEQ